MTKETPFKVMSLLGAAMLSMAFLFSVSITNASFAGTEIAMPDPFGPQNVVAVLDSAAGGYSKFVSQYFTGPAQSDLAFLKSSVTENVAWMAEQSGVDFAAMFGVHDLALQTETPLVNLPAAGRVAGAYTSRFQ